MAEKFLDQLPRVRRGTLGKANQECPICKQEYGTTPSASGIIERAVKLPCDHIMGSECISSWLLAANNTCPICRHNLFQIHTPDPETPPPLETIPTVLSDRCEVITARLGLRSVVSDLAEYFAGRITDLGGVQRAGIVDSPTLADVAASVYAASHMLDDPRPMSMVSNVVGLDEDTVRRAYVYLYTLRHDLVDAEMLAEMDLGSPEARENFVRILFDQAW